MRGMNKRERERERGGEGKFSTSAREVSDEENVTC
jgi:hypothetical protein